MVEEKVGRSRIARLETSAQGMRAHRERQRARFLSPHQRLESGHHVCFYAYHLLLTLLTCRLPTILLLL